MTKLLDRDILYAQETREKIECIKDCIMGNIKKELLEIKTIISEMINILDGINGGLCNEEEKVIY